MEAVRHYADTHEVKLITKLLIHKFIIWFRASIAASAPSIGAMALEM